MTKLELTGGLLLVGALAGCGGLIDPTPNGGDDALPDTPSSSPTARTRATAGCPTPLVALDASCPCSRRACSPPSRSCAPGSGKSTTTRVGPAGGTASLDTANVPFQVQVFAGSLARDVNLELSELAVPTPDGYEDWSPVYTIQPFGLEFVNGGALQIPFEVPHSGGGSVPKALTTFTATSLDGPWQALPDNYINGGFCQATVLQGGYFFVGMPAPDDACH